MGSVISQVFPPKSKFNVEDIPDLSGKVMIVTGANTGIGKETAKALLLHNAKVYIAVRSEEKARYAINELREKTGKEAIFLKLDLADFKSIKASAEEFISKEKELHVLFNNAGVMMPPIEQLTTQEYDLQFGTNVLGHFYFTKLLLPVLIVTAKRSSDGKTRIVNTSSSGHLASGGLDFNTLKDSPARKRTHSFKLYAQSKLGNILVSNELARRYGDKGIVSTSLHPGALKSDLCRYLSPFVPFMAAFFLYPTPYGALTQLYAGTSPEGAEFNGKYLIPWARLGEPSSIANDQKLAAELWTWLEEQVKDI